METDVEIFYINLLVLGFNSYFLNISYRVGNIKLDFRLE